MVYNFEENEFRFLLAFRDIPRLTADDIFDIESISAPEEAIKGLMDKKCLFSENNELYLSKELNFYMDIIGDPYAAIRISGIGKKMWAFFKEDAILLIIAENGYQVMWLPFINFLIGATASFMEPYLNGQTLQVQTVSRDENIDYEKSLLAKGYQIEYEAAVYKGHAEAEDIIYKIYSNSEDQYMLFSTDEQVIISKPCKTDMVNSITKITANLHSESMKQINRNEY